VRICSWLVSKVLLINCAMQMKMCLITHQKFVRLDFQSVFPQTDDKIASASLCPDYLTHALLVICVGEDSDHYAGCAVHSYQTYVRLERAYVQSSSDCGWRTPKLGQRFQVCELRCRQVAFTRDRAFFTPLPYPSTDCIWRWGFLLISFTRKSALTLCNWPRQNKQFHSTHTSYSPALHFD